MGTENLHNIFNPKRIAVVGASDRETSIGSKILRNISNTGFAGEVYVVNPFRQTVQGRIAYPSVSRIPEKLDLAVVATPAQTVPAIIEECGISGVKGVIIVSAGFREVGEAGAKLERQIVDSQRKFSMRIIGPSSFGVMRPKVNLFATFAEKPPRAGKTAFISQSAALCASALDWSRATQVGFSAVVSTGSMIDVDMGDLIDYLAMDPQTRSIMLYIESIKNPRKFMSAARNCARDKPIVLVKAGRFKESSEATVCHSGAIAGDDAVYEGAFKRAGIVRVETIGQLFDCAEALAMLPRPTSPNLTIITNAGGPAIMAVDRLVSREGKLSALSASTLGALKSVLPSYCCIANPVDIFEEATLERYRDVLEICVQDPSSNGFLVIYTLQGATDPIMLAGIITEVAKKTDKPILTCLMSEDERCREARKILQHNNIPSFATPEQAASTFMYMFRYSQNLELLYQTPEELQTTQVNKLQLKRIIRRAFCERRAVLSLPESMTFLEAYEIPAVRTLVAHTPEEAISMASELGYPIVMKALSPQVSHKSNIEGVILNIWSPSETAVFFNDLSAKVRSHSIDAEFQGVVIQPMVREKGNEVLVGAKKDPQFGTVLLFGTGGTAAESFRDVSIGFPPLNQVLARRLVEDTAIFKRVASAKLPFNVKALEETLVKFSQLVADFPEIKEIDVNPLIVNGNSAVAVDARIAIEWDRLMREVADHSDQTLIATYPAKYVSARELRDGTKVLLRPIKAEDEGRFNDLFKSLSPESMRFRFFEIIKELSHDALTRYCNLDYDREIAFVAELQNSKQVIGVGGVVLEANGKVGEFAVLVRDPWQSRGLGSLLMDNILDVARDLRLERLFAHILPNNYKMLNLCKKKGFELETLDEETVKASLSF